MATQADIDRQNAYAVVVGGFYHPLFTTPAALAAWDFSNPNLLQPQLFPVTRADVDSAQAQGLVLAYDHTKQSVFVRGGTGTNTFSILLTAFPGTTTQPPVTITPPPPTPTPQPPPTPTPQPPPTPTPPPPPPPGPAQPPGCGGDLPPCPGATPPPPAGGLVIQPLPAPAPVSFLPTDTFTSIVAKQLGNFGTSTDGFDVLFSVPALAFAADLASLNDFDGLISVIDFVEGAFDAGNYSPVADALSSFLGIGDAFFGSAPPAVATATAAAKQAATKLAQTKAQQPPPRTA